MEMPETEIEGSMSTARNMLMKIPVPYVEKKDQLNFLCHKTVYINVDQLITVHHAPPEKDWLAFGISSSCLLRFSDGTELHLDIPADEFCEYLNGAPLPADYGEE